MTSELPASVSILEVGDTTYFVIGTAHVSQTSVDEVRHVIEEVKPDVVCVELCKSRHDALTKDSAFRDLDVFKVVREGKTLYLLAHLALSSYQRRIGASLGVKPGAELLAAVTTARDKGIPVELIDRDINVTLKRTWANLGLWKRSMLLSSLLVGWEDEKGEPVTEKTVEDLKDPKALSEILTELGNAVPEVKGPLVDERDKYLMSRMLESGAGRKKVVAVVGAAHVPGMKEQVGTTIDRTALDKIPPLVPTARDPDPAPPKSHHSVSRRAVLGPPLAFRRRACPPDRGGTREHHDHAHDARAQTRLGCSASQGVRRAGHPVPALRRSSARARVHHRPTGHRTHPRAPRAELGPRADRARTRSAR